MHNKKNIVIIVSLALLGLVVWYFYPSSEPLEVQQVSTVKGEQAEVQQQEPEKKPLLVKDVLNNPYAHPKRYEQVKRVQRLQDAMSSGFEYYGKVVDQRGEPVVGANVLVQWGYFPFIPNGDFSPSYKNLTFTTDKEGRFSIKKSKGMSLAFGRNDIKKEGYEIDAYRAYMFSDGGYKMLQSFSNPAKPVIFHAWKKTEAEGLVHDILEVGYRPDGKFYRVSLKGVEEQLKISFIADPNGNRSSPLDWSMKLKVIDGGIIESTDTFMNEAPLEGYLPILSYQYKKSDKGFSNDIRKKFYIKARNGQVYGRLECRIHPYYGRDNIVAVDIKYWINPNGSRNLQYDSKKRIYPK